MATIPFILIAVTIGVIGQILIKKGLNLCGEVNFSIGFISAYTKIFFSPHVILGVLTYVCSIFFWLYALSKVDLSFAYPFLALSYVLIVFASQFYLGENVPFIRWVGVFVICFGVLLVSRS